MSKDATRLQLPINYL